MPISLIEVSVDLTSRSSAPATRYKSSHHHKRKAQETLFDSPNNFVVNVENVENGCLTDQDYLSFGRAKPVKSRESPDRR